MSRAAILAVDGGNSKTELLLAGRNGRLLGLVRGGSISHQAVGMYAGMARLERLVDAASQQSGEGVARPAAAVGVFCLAGADHRSEINLLSAGIAGAHVVSESVVLNDTRAALRAGSPSGWGVAVICGSGVNAVGVAPDGRVASLPALGPISGDWGGGLGIGQEALSAAVRGRDLRGPHTVLEHLVPGQFGMSRPLSVTWALYHGRLETGRLRELSPVVAQAASEGDAVARAIMDRLADELATMALSILRRLHLVRAEVDVVLAGGVMRTVYGALIDRISAHVTRHAPRARIHRLTEPPVLGAGLLALDRIGASATALARLRREVAAAKARDVT